MFKEFKEFALKGNVIDLAIGVIIGAAFNGIVTSFVNDIISPILSLFTGRLDFANRFIAISTRHFNTIAEAKAAGIATINYGVFINALINFLIVAFVLFLIVKRINQLKRKAPPPESNTKLCPYCQSLISKKATRCPNCTSQITGNPTS
jgi:large conductance mechanosensitive channel